MSQIAQRFLRKIIELDDALSAYTPGALLFFDSSNILNEDATNLFWDDTLDFLRIGPTSATNGTRLTLSDNQTSGKAMLVIADITNSSTTRAGIDFTDITAAGGPIINPALSVENTGTNEWTAIQVAPSTNGRMNFGGGGTTESIFKFFAGDAALATQGHLSMSVKPDAVVLEVEGNGATLATFGLVAETTLSLSAGSTGVVRVNPNSTNNDFVVNSDTVADFFKVNADAVVNMGGIIIGGGAPAGPADVVFDISAPAHTITGGADTALIFSGTGNITIPTGTSKVVDNLQLAQLGLVINGSVTDAATLHIIAAPVKASGSGTLGTARSIWVQAGLTELNLLKVNDQITLADRVDITVNTGTGTKIGTATTQKLGLWNNAPIVRPAAWTQNFTTATRTVSAYTTDAESSAYTGIDNLQVGTPYAKVVDLNALRVAYENLRASHDNLLQVVTQIIDDDQLFGLRG